MSSNPHDIESRLISDEVSSGETDATSGRNSGNVVDFVIVGTKKEDASESTAAEPDSDDEMKTSESGSLVKPGALAKRQTIEELRRLAEHLPKSISIRYSALIVNMWSTSTGSSRFEVALVNVRNGDHRNGVVRALRVSPLDVSFVPMNKEVFDQLVATIHSDDTQEFLEAKKEEQSKQTKVWTPSKERNGESGSSAAADQLPDLIATDWVDLTDTAEYERNLNRNEADLTTQEFIRLILNEFLRSGSSDMHIESGQPSGRIRFRYDSELFTRWDDIPFQKIRQIAAGLAETAGKDATRMKFKDIDSTIKVRVLRDGVPADLELRFASQPTLYSPSIVLRSQLKPIRDLAGVGFLKDQIRDLEHAYSQKRGIIVVTGATGSGKTNTLEAIFAKLEEPDTFKIIEIGEPIEIRSRKRTQISLRPNTPFTWWDAFYSCLRSDPDIIGIGELRSSEHLSVAINAALTGHLVLSTFHAASVEDTLTRMFQMGIPRENLATGINLILAQTLIKKLCPSCKKEDAEASSRHGMTVYTSEGCQQCFGKGTRGRTAMAEVLIFNDDVKQWIQDKTLSARDVVKKAISRGYLLPMRGVAKEKLGEGTASVSEINGALGYIESNEAFGSRDWFARESRSEIQNGSSGFRGNLTEIDFIEGEVIED